MIATLSLVPGQFSNVTIGTGTATYSILDDDTRVTSITRQTPSSSPTDADSLTWRVTFDGAVQNVDATDFTISGTTAALAVAAVPDTNAYDVTASGGDLADLISTGDPVVVTLGFADNQNIEDTRGNALATTTPRETNDNTFAVANTATLSIGLSRMSITEGHASQDRSTVVNYGMSTAYPAPFPFLACVDVASSTATHRTASGGKAADFNLVEFSSPYDSVPLTTDGGNCHLYTYPANTTNQTLRLSVLGDGTAEGDERAVVSIKRAPGTPANVVLGTSSATLSITNDDGTPPVITIAAVTSPVEEGTGASFTVNANPAPAVVDLDVSVVVSQGGAVVTSGNLGAKTVTIPVNTTSTVYTVATDNDRSNEVNGNVTVTVNSKEEGYTVGSLSSATVTVNDNDAQRISETGALVSNISKTESSAVAPTGGAGGSCLAQRFQTGTNPDGYNVESVVLKVGSLHTSGTPSITVWRDDGNTPDGGFTPFETNNPVRFTPNGLQEFVIDQGGAILNGNTRYWVMNCHEGSGSGLSWVRTSQNAGIDSGGAAGWTIDSAYRLGDANSAGFTRSLKMQIKGTPINAADKTAPRVTSIERQMPSSYVTDADSLTWRVTFNEAVRNVDAGDFQLSGTTASLEVAAVRGNTTYDVTASGGNLAGLNATVMLNFANGQNITDINTNSLVNTTPTGSNDNRFFVVTASQPLSTHPVLVGNISQEGSGSRTSRAGNLGFCLGQRFRTGSNTAGYNLESVVLKVGSLHTSGTPNITVHGDSSNTPGNRLYGTNNPDTFTADKLHEFRVSGSGRLDGNTWYWLMGCHDDVSNSFSFSWDLTSRNAGVDPGAAPGWTIQSGYRVSSSTISDFSLKMQIRGTPIPSVDSTAPRVTSITRQTPSTSPTDADSLTWRVTFNEAVQNVDAGDFRISGTTASLVVAPVAGATAYDVTASGGNLAGLSATVTLSFDNGQTIQDSSGNPLPLANTTPTGTNDNTFEVNNTPLPVLPVITIAAGPSPVEEGTEASFTVNASTATTTNLDVSVAVSQSGAFVTSSDRGGKTVTITADATSTTVTVPTVNDLMDESNGSVTVTVNQGTGYRVGSTATATVTVNDNDTAAVNISTATLMVTEASGAGRTDSYTLVLATQPSHEVNITPTSDDSAAATVSPATLTFSTTNWNTAQTVTVTAMDDSVDQTGNRRVTISHGATSSDGNYNGNAISIPGVTAAVVDNDGAGLVIDETGTPKRTEVSEDGTTTMDTYRVALATRPGHEVTVTAIASPGAQLATGGAAAATASLSFSTTNWNTPQTVTVTGVDDATDNPGGSREVSISHTATSTDPAYSISGGLGGTVAAVVRDDDPTTVILSGAVGNIEEGEQKTFTITLGRGLVQGETLTVPLTFGGTAHRSTDYTLSGTAATGVDYNNLNSGSARVVFTGPSSGATATSATITLSATADGVAESTLETVDIGSGIITNIGLGTAGGVRPTASLAPFTIADGVLAGVNITQSGGSTSVSEAAGGPTDSYTVVLNSQPTATVTITVTSSDPAAATVRPPTLSFTPSNWNVEQWVTVTGVDDRVESGNRTVTIRHSATSSHTLYSGIPIPDVIATVVDGGTTPPAALPAVEFAAAAYTGGETSGNRTVNVLLSANPAFTALTTVSYSVSGTSTAGQDFNTLHGTVSIIGASGAIPVTILDDQIDDDGETILLTLTAANGYRVGAQGSTTITITDDDGMTPPPPATRPVVSITAGAAINEGKDASFTLTATPAPPTGETISVHVRISDSGDFATSGHTGSRSITIDAGGAATFIVTTEDDTTQEDDGRITATVQPGRGYTPHGTTPSASLTVEDDEVVMLSTPNLRVTAGDSASYQVALDERPTADVTVTIRVGGVHGEGGMDGGAAIRVHPATLTFTPANWHLPQPVTLTAPEEGHLIGAAITLTHTANGGGHADVTTTMTLTVVATYSSEETKAWHLRLGRTLSQQVVDALQHRLTSPPTTGRQLTVAGETIPSPMVWAEHEGFLSKALGFETVTPQTLVEGSSFNVAPQTEGGAPRLAFWGQGAFSSFRGKQETLSLDGGVTTLLLGADWHTERWQAGTALSHSWGSGSYDGDDGADGEISTTVTGIFPYGRHALNPRLGLWAVAGYGWGQLSLKPDGHGDDATPNTTLAMAAVGLDGVLLHGGSEAVTLTTTADVLTLNTSSQAGDGLDSSEGSLSRLRLGIEATRPFPLSNGSSLLPSLEMAIRQDGGDAETGFGLDLGAAILWSYPQQGITGSLAGRTLLAHAEEDFHEQGLALSFSWQPHPAKLGPSLSIRHNIGATADGGIHALLKPNTMQEVDTNNITGQRFAAELAYGFTAYHNHITLTPALALALSPSTTNYTLLWSIAPYTQQLQAETWQLSLAGERHQHNTATSPVEHSLKLNFSTLF